MQDNSEARYLLQSSLPGGARLCRTYITVRLLPPPNSAFWNLHRCWCPVNILHPQALPQHLLQLNPNYHKCLLCFSGRHPNHKVSASPEWYPVHTLTNFPGADCALVLSGAGKFERTIKDYRHCSRQIKRSARELSENSLDYREDRWVPGEVDTREGPSVHILSRSAFLAQHRAGCFTHAAPSSPHDHPLLWGRFYHPWFTVLETERLHKFFKVTNTIIDAWNSFNNKQSSSFHTQKVGLKPWSIFGDGKFRMMTGFWGLRVPCSLTGTLQVWGLNLG